MLQNFILLDLYQFQVIEEHTHKEKKTQQEQTDFFFFYWLILLP